MPSLNTLNKDSIDLYLSELAKELKKEYKNIPNNIELVIVGGASILLNYSFRISSNDIDCLEYPTHMIKGASNRVADKYNLPNGWINSDFIETKSFAKEIILYSTFYKTYSNILDVRTITKEYLIAMKLMSFREYKQDISDIVNILIEEENNGNKITIDDIAKAVKEMYGSFDRLENAAKEFIISLLKTNDKLSILEDVQSSEKAARENLLNSKERR